MRTEENILKSLSQNFRNTDKFFLQLTFTLLIIGLIFSFSSSSYESFRLSGSFWILGIKQLIAFLIGMLFLITFWLINYNTWFKITWTYAMLILITMIITVFTGIGRASGGSQRWIDIGFFQFQPAELSKIAVIFLLSRLFSKYKWSSVKTYLYLAFISILILIILKQPDLGTASILGLLVFQIMFICGCPIWLLLLAIALAGIFCYLKIFQTPYQLNRIVYWLDPYKDPLGKGYNLIQSKYAFALGGLLGSGFGSSIQKQGYLPVPHSDFIFAVISEEVGLLGTLAILILYITWMFRGFYLTNKVKSRYGRILAFSILLLISTQAIINISVTIGLIPATGVTLPFFSCGGTSLMVTLAMCGILLNVFSNESSTKLSP